MYSKMPTKRKISIFFGLGWPSIMSKLAQTVDRDLRLSPGLLKIGIQETVVTVRP